jgi:hypothetical protein
VPSGSRETYLKAITAARQNNKPLNFRSAGTTPGLTTLKRHRMNHLNVKKYQYHKYQNKYIKQKRNKQGGAAAAPPFHPPAGVSNNGYLRFLGQSELKPQSRKDHFLGSPFASFSIRKGIKFFNALGAAPSVNL